MPRARPMAIPPKTGQGGVTLLEIVMAMAILMAAMVPMLDVFGISGLTVAKSQNLSMAVGLAHKISQHLLALPFDSIVDRAEAPLADGPDDQMFNPLANLGTSQAGNLKITASQMPELYAFLKKYKVCHGLDVVGDAPKDVKIIITWVEQGRNMMYALRVYVSRR